MIDAHGYYVEYGNNYIDIDLKNLDWSYNYTSLEISATSGNAVVLIRNPFQAIYEYRDLTYGSHAGHTTSYQFFGTGIWQFESK